MCLISAPNLNEIHLGEGCFFWLKFIVSNWCKEEEKYEENWAILRNAYFKSYLADFPQVWYAKLCI